MSLTFQERISLSTKSIENYRLHAPSVLEELSSNFNQNSQPFLDNIEKIVLSNSEQPSRKFYALYLLLKATENKPSQDFLAKLSFKNDLNSHISQTAQYDMDKLGPMNEKGKTLFFTSPSPSQAITGTNYVRLCAECVLYWGKRFGKDEPNHSFYGFWFQNQIVSKRVNLNATYNFVGKTYYGKEELTSFDFTLPPKVNDIRQPPNFNLESSQSIQEVILDNSLSSKKDLLESGTTFIKKKTPDFNQINQETIIKPLGKAEGIKKSVHSITPETEQIPLAQLSNAFHERAPSQPKGLKRLPSNAEESSKAHIQQEIQGNGFSLAQLSNTYHQYQPQPAEVLKKVETEIPQITRNGEALKKSFQSADRGQMQIPISQGGFESLERGFTPPQASPKTKVAQSNSVPADKTSPLDFKVEKEIELKRPFATLFKNDSLPNPRSPATIPVVTRVAEEPRRSFEPILRPSTGKAQSLSQMKNEQDILQVARLNSDLIQANQSFDENGRKSLSRQGSLLGQGKNVKIVFSDKGDDEEDLVNDSLFAREQVDTPKDLVSMVNHHAKPQEKVKSSIPKRQVPEEDINEEGPIQNLQGPVKVKVAARVDPVEQERVSHKFRPTLSQERASVGRNTAYDDPNATEEFYKENPYILMTQNESYKQENMYLMEEVQKYQEELRRRDEKEKFIEKQNHFLKARVANFDQELSEMRKSIGKLAETSQQLNQNLLSQTGSYSPFTPVKFDGSPDVMYSPIRSSETPRKNIFESPTYERPSALLNMAPRDSRK